MSEKLAPRSLGNSLVWDSTNPFEFDLDNDYAIDIINEIHL